MKTERLNGLDGVAETLLIPLCYRAVEARRADPLVRDPRAQEIIDQLGVDPAHLKWRASQQLFAMLRARKVDQWAGEFLAQHDQVTVVEIGCGLDARFDRLDDGKVGWVDMDLPEVIDLRRRFFADTPRRKMLAHSAFDLSWLDCLPREGAHLFLCEGVFPYFDESEVRRVTSALAKRFPGSEMVMDGLSSFMVRFSAVVPSFRAYQVRPRWGVSDPRVVEGWGSGIRLLESYRYFDDTDPRLAPVRWMQLIPGMRNLARVLRIRLGGPPDFYPIMP